MKTVKTKFNWQGIEIVLARTEEDRGDGELWYPIRAIAPNGGFIPYRATNGTIKEQITLVKSFLDYHLENSSMDEMRDQLLNIPK